MVVADNLSPQICHPALVGFNQDASDPATVQRMFDEY